MKELFAFLYKSGVSPNGLYVLQAIDSATVYPAFVNFMTEQRRLLLSGHLEQDTTGQQAGIAFILTPAGKELLKQADKLLSSGKKSKKLSVPFAEWEEEIHEFIQLFPTGKQSSQPIRSHPKEVYERFLWFFSTYPEYTWEHVLSATEQYINALRLSADGFKWVSTAKNFVKKEDKNRTVSSVLASWCENIRTGDIEEEPGTNKTYFRPNIL